MMNFAEKYSRKLYLVGGEGWLWVLNFAAFSTWTAGVASGRTTVVVVSGVLAVTSGKEMDKEVRRRKEKSKKWEEAMEGDQFEVWWRCFSLLEFIGEFLFCFVYFKIPLFQFTDRVSLRRLRRSKLAKWVEAWL